jgi:uncharacterized protein (DUF1684 family)
MRNALWYFVTLALLGLPMFGCSKDPGDKIPVAAIQTITAEVLAKNNATWREERLASLSKPDSWFSLVGLDWLSEGENTIGSDPDSDVVLPASLPAKVGVIHLTDGKVLLETVDGVEVRIGDDVTTSSGLAPDTSGEPTEVRLGSVLFYLIERGDQMGIRIKDSEAEALREFHSLDYYPTDPAWFVAATLKPYEPPKMVPIANVLGQISDSPSPGALEFQVGDTTYSLDTLEGDDGGFFLIFGDTTNGPETYGAGRFLETDAPDENGRVMIDFNQAYSPPCAFSPYATCPLPPPQNKLALAVPAGEKNYAGGHS